MKYIIINDFYGIKAFLFDEELNHANFADLVSPDYLPISAGFVKLDDGHIYCHGNSISLHLSSRTEDLDIIRKALE